MHILLNVGRWGSAAGIFLVAAGFAPEAPSAPISMKLATYANTPFNHEYLKEFRKRIAAKSGNRIQATIGSGVELRNAGQILKEFADGEALLFLAPPETLTTIDPAYGVAMAPGLFKSQAHAAQSFATPAFAALFKKFGEAKGIRTIGQYVNGPYTFFLKKPATTMKFADLKGLKLRVVGAPMENVIVRALGATGIPNYFAATLPPDKRTVIDGARVGLDAAVMAKWYKATPITIESYATYTSTMAILGAKWFNTLDENLKNAVLDAAAETDGWAAGESVKWYKGATKDWIAAGGKVLSLSPEAEENLRKMARHWVTNLYKDPTLTELYDDLHKTANVVSQ